ncbi:MAG: hypothetical protein ACRDGI_05010 [Candidatus Limnocylindrales bacterium]
MVSKVRRFGARRFLTALLAIGLVGIVAVPAISAASTGASEPASVATSAPNSVGAAAGDAGQVDEAALTPAALRLGGKLLNRVVRGDLTVRAKGGTYVQVHYERGKISAVSATSITITGPDGKGAAFTVTTNTKVRSQGKLEAIGDLSVGQNALVFGTVSGSTYSAVLVHGIVARPAKNAAPGATSSTAP